MNALICPSMMCADFSKLTQEVQELDQAGTDIFHMDVMDGHYVPNLALGVEDYKAVRSLTDKRMDVHLMVQEPSKYIDIFADLGANLIYIHPDSENVPTSTIAKIKEKGMQVGIAINPGTTVAEIEGVLPIVDYVLVMTVNPGFSGQPFLDYVVPKIEQLRAKQADYHYSIMVDGAISPQRIEQLSQLGVEGFIVGTSALFGKSKSYQELIPELKTIATAVK